MPQNGKRKEPSALDMPVWMMVLVITVMLLIAGLAFWFSARSSHESLPLSRPTQQR